MRDNKLTNLLCKNDIILMVLLIFLSLIPLALINLTSVKGDFVCIYVDNSLYGKYPIKEDCDLDISAYNNGLNHLVIKDGYAYMSEASCPDKLCVNQGKINNNSQTICCMPNRVVIKIENKEEVEYDGITQ